MKAKEMPETMEELIKKIPLLNVEYARRSKPPYHHLIFYIRWLPVVRDYQPGSHRLYKIGIWDETKNSGTTPPTEYAFAQDDQLAMFDFVFKIIVKPHERRRFVGRVKKIVENVGEQDRLHLGD